MDILYLGPEDMLPHLEEELPQEVFHYALTPTDVDAVISRCQVILDAYMRVPFNADRLALAEQLTVFVTATTGSDHIDSDALARRDIPLLTLKGQRDLLNNITPAAEHSWLLLMACARQLRGAVTHVLDGEWDRNQFPGLMLRGKTLGVIGCGRIGTWMSRYASGFAMDVIGYDPYLSVEDLPDTIRPVTWDSLLREADIVSIHVHLSDETHHLLDEDAFKVMKPGVIVVNTSRGDVLDQAALLDGLRTGHIGAAGLDVLSGEPDIAGHPLLDYARENNNLVITPHIGGFSPDALRYVLSFCASRIRDFETAQKGSSDGR
jgi:phosphoglycerate dehydrogenase-like enzyme